MTNDEAIKTLELISEFDVILYSQSAKKYIEALFMAIEALRVQNSTKATQDTISRQDAIDALKEEEYPCLTDYDEGFMAALDKAIWIMEKWLSSAQPEIIRCKDCREFRRYIDTDITFCDRTEVEVKDDDFCSRAYVDV